jgi:hypothetical protein
VFTDAVFAAGGSGALDARELLAHRVATSLTAGTVMPAFALALVFALIVRPEKAANRDLREIAWKYREAGTIAACTAELDQPLINPREIRSRPW